MRMTDNRQIGPMTSQAKALEALMKRYKVTYQYIGAAASSLPGRRGQAISESTLSRFMHGTRIKLETLQDIARALGAISVQRETEGLPNIPQNEIDLILKPVSVPLEAQT